MLHHRAGEPLKARRIFRSAEERSRILEQQEPEADHPALRRLIEEARELTGH